VTTKRAWRTAYMKRKAHMLKGASVLLAVLSSIAFLDVRAQEGLRPGVKAPDFELPSIGNSNRTALREFQNKKIVIVHFWKSK